MSSINQLMQTAWQQHQAGHLVQAEALYRKALKITPDNADVIHLLGVLNQQVGKPAEAIKLIQRAALINPGNPYYLCSLAEAYLASNNHDKAIESYQQALSMNPQLVDAHNNLGVLLMQRQSDEVADKHFRQALTLNPEHANALHNLGELQAKQQQTDLAIDCFTRALKSQPHRPETHFQLANVFHADNQNEQALTHYRKALKLNPAHAGAHNNIATLLRQQGALEEATSHYHTAVELMPDNPVVHRNLAAVLVERRLYDEAACEYEQALKIDPDYVEALSELGDVYRDQGRTDDAREKYHQAYKLSPQQGLQVKSAILLPVILQSRDQIGTLRQTLSDNLDRLLQQPLAIEDPYREVGATGFYLAYHGQNDRELQEKLARLFILASPSLEWQAPHCIRPRVNHSKVRIGFVSRHFRDHSIGKVTRGWVEQLSRADFSVTVFTFSRPEDELARTIHDAADENIKLPLDLAAARQVIAERELDVLFYPDIGMDPFTYFLAFARLAPVQCTTFGHPVTTGIPNMDYFISTDIWETEDAPRHYSEKLIKLGEVASTAYCYRPSMPSNLNPRSRFGFSEHDHIYLCAQTLFKFHPDFDDILGALLRRDPAGILVLKDSLHTNWTKLLLQRFRESLPDVLPRIKFLGHLSRKDYLSLLACADVMLDPLHFGGFTTTLEGLALDIPVVTLAGELMRGRHTLGLYRRMGFMECVAENKEAYVEKALRLGTDSGYRLSVKGVIHRSQDSIWEEHAVITNLEQFLLRATGQHQNALPGNNEL